MRETVYQLSAPNALSIALISDLHNRPFHALLSSLRTHQPDLIAITGDLIVGHLPADNSLAMEYAEYALPFLRGCAKLAPAYFSLGNHEWMLCADDLALLRSTGVQLLDNSWITHKAFAIGGLTSGRVTAYRESVPGWRTGYSKTYEMPSHSTVQPPNLDWLDSFEHSGMFRILLCHHPEYWPRYLRKRSIDLVLSGHAHGGQIRLFGRGLYAPGQGIFPRYTSSVHEGRLVVSRGLANTTVIPRLFNPPEIVYVELSPR